MKEGGLSAYLFDEGLDKIPKKVEEEAIEVIIAGKAAQKTAFRGEGETLFFCTAIRRVIGWKVYGVSPTGWFRDWERRWNTKWSDSRGCNN